MALSKEIQDIMRLLEERTIARKINWRPTGLSSEYTTVVDGISVVVDKWTPHETVEKLAEIVVRNKDGKDVIREQYHQGAPEGLQICALYDVIHQSFTRKDETIATLLKALKGPKGLLETLMDRGTDSPGP
jgi:hypothetical protein